MVYSLIEHRVSGIVGDRDLVSGILNNLLVPIAAYHSYDEVRLCSFVMNQISGNIIMSDGCPTCGIMISNAFSCCKYRRSAGFVSIFLREMQRYKEYAIRLPIILSYQRARHYLSSCAFLAELLKDDTLHCFSYIWLRMIL